MSTRPYSNVRVIGREPLDREYYESEEPYYDEEDERGYEVPQVRGAPRRDNLRAARGIEYQERAVDPYVSRGAGSRGPRVISERTTDYPAYSTRSPSYTTSSYGSRVPGQYTTEETYVSRSAVPAYESYETESYDEYDDGEFPSYVYGESTTTYQGAVSALDYIDERRSKSGKRKWNPICDMGETPTYWLIRCEIPGVRKDRLKIEIEGKDLVIKGKRVKELWNLDKLGAAPTPVPTPTTTTATGTTTTTTSAAAGTKFTPDARMSGVNWLNKERGGRGTFKRRVRLPERVDNSAIQALYKDGILEVLVKKPELQAIKQAKAAAQAKAIAIQHS